VKSITDKELALPENRRPTPANLLAADGGAEHPPKTAVSAKMPRPRARRDGGTAPEAVYPCQVPAISPALPMTPVVTAAKPLLKWAGGKTQLLSELTAKLPKKYNKYIEPFIGGGALFFSLSPERGVIADSNPELVMLYRAVADDAEGVIAALGEHVNSSEHFYEVRARDWRTMPVAEAAARTIFLNRTCFNGLYRVNRSGGFNVPFGHYKNPKLVDAPALRAAAEVLQRSTIVLGDYKTVLLEQANAGDLVFLDPPYLPISEYSDFKRYTAEQFYEEDHRELAAEVARLHELGAHVIITNSNHPLVHELFQGHEIEIVQTKRNISSDASKRNGEDVIVNIPPRRRFSVNLAPQPINAQTAMYPTTRYMGSKTKLLSEIWAVGQQFDYDTVLDLFSGSGVVSYMFKSQGKRVVSNDYMTMAATYARAMIENNSVTLSGLEALKLVNTTWESDNFVQRTFAGLYFTDEDNAFIDNIRGGIKQIKNPQKRAIAMSALMRTCMKKRPRGIFTYVGDRYGDGRKDLATTFHQHFLDAVELVNGAVFDNGRVSRARIGDAMTVPAAGNSLVYIDPPYFSTLSDNEYVRRYHFVEGLARDWEGVEIQEHTLTKKFKNYPTPFSSRVGAADAFDKLFRRHRDSILVVSYSSNSQPGLDEMVGIMSRYKKHVEVVPVNYRYSFGTHGHKVGDNRNSVQEYLFVGF
jgi:DNA adenine methylase